MKKIYLEIVLEYDDVATHGEDPEAKDWFFNDILGGVMGELTMFSSEIGDVIGDVTVMSIEDGDDE